MTRELGREYPELDDPSVFEHMVAMTVKQMEPVSGQLRRGQHAKATGCVTAEFRIANDVPPKLRHGIFSQPGRAYRAMVRFSNSQGTFEKDGVGTARGLAIKLLDVAGARAVPGDGDTTQDFLMIDHPVFPFPDPKAYVDTIGRKNVPLIGNLFAAAHLALLGRDEFKIINEIRGKRVASPLEIKYWSGAPFRLGPASGDGALAVKYSLTSHQADRTTPSDHPEDLRGRLPHARVDCRPGERGGGVRLQGAAAERREQDACRRCLGRVERGGFEPGHGGDAAHPDAESRGGRGAGGEV